MKNDKIEILENIYFQNIKKIIQFIFILKLKKVEKKVDRFYGKEKK